MPTAAIRWVAQPDVWISDWWARAARTPRSVWLPLLFFQLYLSGSLLALALGPVTFEIDNAGAVYTYALLGQLFVLLGFCLGAVRPARGYNGRIPLDVVLGVAIVVTMSVSVATILLRNYADLSLLEALRDPGAAYRARFQDLKARESAPIFSIVRAFLGPILGLFLPAGILFWRRLSAWWRILWCLGLAGLAGEAVLTGAAKGVFDVALAAPWFLWLYFSAHRSDRPGRRRFRARQLVVGAVAAAVLIGAFGWFGHTRQSRWRLTGDQYQEGSTGWSEERWGFSIPDGSEHLIYQVTRYLTLGYLGLSGSLELPFEWSYGLGHSRVLMKYFGPFISSSLDETTYPARLEKETGYRRMRFWHTIYPWLASDLTFPGALVFIGVMGYLLARAWRDSMLGKNPFAAGFLLQLLLMFYYIPASNIRLMFSEEVLAFWGLFALWILTSRSETGVSGGVGHAEN